MIQLYHVTKRYRRPAPALNDVTLQIGKGEFVCVTGPSGAGKTTLLKLIFCEEQADQGQLLVMGRNVARIPPRQAHTIRRSIGMVYQDFRLLPARSLFDNVLLAPRVAGHSLSESHQRTLSALRLVGLEQKRSALPGELSAGEQQRACIARALVNEPPILLADEPTGNLDEELAWEIGALLQKIHLKGTTVILASHNRGLIARLGCRVITLKDGGIVKDEGGS
ncbi:MAG: ATP-binding cassette domain-containing protein [Nitrospirota bacterium]